MGNEYKLSFSAQEIDEKLNQISIPNYEQNNSQGKGYIKNRPFYVDDNGGIHKLDTKFLKTTEEITSNSTSNEIPTAKSVYDIVKTESNSSTLRNIVIGNTTFDIINNEIVIPIATKENFGVVKSSSATNDIAVREDGTMEINEINVNKIVQDSGDTLLLASGTSKL